MDLDSAFVRPLLFLVAIAGAGAVTGLVAGLGKVLRGRSHPR